jgi:hypothetical protein
MPRTQKVSVALQKDALVAAKKAAVAEGSSLSGFLMRLLNAEFERRARFDSMDRFIEKCAPNVRVTEADMQAIRDEMTAPLKPVRRSKRKRAA